MEQTAGSYRELMTPSCISMATVSVTCLLTIFNPLLFRHVASDFTYQTTVKCMLGNDTSCPAHHCCVKKVVTYRDSKKEPLVGTECQPLLTEGAMCLKTPEDYLCSCLPTLNCHLSSRYDTMGYCKPHHGKRNW